MGSRHSLDTANIFERRLSQALASSAHVFLFDQMTLHNEVGEYFSSYYQLCENSGRDLFELEGSIVSEQNLIQVLETVKRKGESAADAKNGPQHSPFRVLCNRLEAREPGIICIHNAHLLSNEGVEILSKLVRYVRRMKLRWQFMIFADAIRIDDLSKLQLSIDLAYPEHILQSDGKADKNTKTEKDADKTVVRKQSWQQHQAKILAVVTVVGLLLVGIRYI